MERPNALSRVTGRKNAAKRFYGAPCTVIIRKWYLLSRRYVAERMKTRIWNLGLNFDEHFVLRFSTLCLINWHWTPLERRGTWATLTKTKEINRSSGSLVCCEQTAEPDANSSHSLSVDKQFIVIESCQRQKEKRTRQHSVRLSVWQTGSQTAKETKWRLECFKPKAWPKHHTMQIVLKRH